MPIPGPHQDVLPSSDASFGVFATSFAAVWVPASFNTVLPTAASVTAAAVAFNSALAIAAAPTTRTGVTIAAKDTQRAICSIVLRDSIRAAQAAFLAGLATEAQINALGVRANSLIRTPIGAPVYGPLVAIDASFPGFMRFRLTQVDQATGFGATTRAFDYGIVGVEVVRSVGSAPFVLRQTLKRVLFQDSTADLVSGVIANYCVRYVTARGLVSPFCAMVSGAVQ
jgi:hypothetical protein